MNHKVDALVPMKGHSERVENKNIREFVGKPLFCYVVSELLMSEFVSRIIIDTDSIVIKEEIKRRFPTERIRIVDRPEKLRGDFAPFFDILEHDMGFSEADHFIQTHATNPLLKAETITKACLCYFENLETYDSLFSVNEFHTRFYNDKFEAMNHDPDNLIRTQDLPPIYEENSNIYIFSKDSFRKKHNRIGQKPYLFKMSMLESVDIDTEEEFALAETVYMNRLMRSEGASC